MLFSLGPCGRPADIKPFPRQGAGLIDDGHLPVQLVPCPWGRLQAIGGQQAAVIVAEQAGRGGHRRDSPVVRPQQEHRPVPLVSQPGHFASVHPVQRHRDGTHVVLREYQREQSGELLQLHGGIPQDLGALFQTAAQNVPQLGVLLRQGGLIPLLQFLGPLCQTLGYPHSLQQAVESHGLALSCLVRLLPQLLQRGGHLPPQAVEPGQQGGVLLGEFAPIALGVVGPVLFAGPGTSLQTPGQGIVFQQIYILLTQISEAGFEAAEEIVVPVAPGYGIQCRSNEG